MPDLVRVRVGRWEYNTGRANAIAKGLHILDEPTHDRTGHPRPRTRLNSRPVKPWLSLSEAVANKSPAAKEAAAPMATAPTWVPPFIDSTINPPSEETES